jgi:hypothetical protein
VGEEAGAETVGAGPVGAQAGQAASCAWDMLSRVRDSGGLVMVRFVPGFLTEECRAWHDWSSPQVERITHLPTCPP